MKSLIQRVALFLLLCQLLQSAQAQQPRPTASPEDIRLFILARKSQDESWHYKDWVNEEWTGNNTPYATMRRAINSLKKQGKLPAKLPSFRKQAAADPLDAKAQFRLVFAEYLLSGEDTNTELVRWRQALSIPVSPQSYDYTRLRFAVTANLAMASGSYGGDKGLRNLGVRLLKVDPKDVMVAYWTRRIRERTDSVEDKKINLRESLSIARRKPKDADTQASLGGDYLNLWMLTKQRAHGSLAIAHYNKYLQLAPKSDSFRKGAQHWINAIPKTQARWDKQKSR